MIKRKISGLYTSTLMTTAANVTVMFTSDSHGETLSLEVGNHMITVPYEVIEGLIKQERKKGKKGMSNLVKMIEEVQREMRVARNYSCAILLDPILEEAKNADCTNTCLAIQKVLIDHGIEPLGELANAIFDVVQNFEAGE